MTVISNFCIQITSSLQINDYLTFLSFFPILVLLVLAYQNNSKEFFMLRIFFILFILTYLYSIISNFSQILQLDKCLDALVSFLNSGRYSSYGQIIKNENFDKCLSELLFRYPLICKFTSFYSDTLSYGEDISTTYTSAVKLYNDLRMKRNFLVDDLCTSFNPLSALKKIIAFPSLILKYFGFQPGIHASRLINLLGWILTYLLGLYQDEIKALINSLLKHF